MTDLFFAARQPILNSEQKLFAYELLFRDGMQNVFPDVDAEKATSKMIEGLQSGTALQNLTNQYRAFINFTYNSLIDKFPLMLPHEQVVVEILETATPSRQLLDAVIDLKEKGYQIALDDYLDQPAWRHFFPYIDIIKIDLMSSDWSSIDALKQHLGQFPHIQLLAEKVETYEQFYRAKEMGFSYFQGYFFSRPEVLKNKTLTPSQAALAALMMELNKEETNTSALVKNVESDVNLSFKLLRYVNSPIFYRRNDISSIRQAVTVLGNTELRRFISMLFTATAGAKKPAELTNMALVRARFCESVTNQIQLSGQSESAFLVGLLSTLDAMLDAPLESLLENLALSDEIKQVLLTGTGVLGQILTLVKALETANWTLTIDMEKKLGLSDESAKTLYLDSLQWAVSQQSITA